MDGRYCFVFVIFTCSLNLGHAQQTGQQQKSSVAYDELVVKRHEGSFSRFITVRDRLLEENASEPYLAGRLLLRKYPARLLDRVATPYEPEVVEAPAECYVCDFAIDYVDFRMRQDWATIEIPKNRIDFKSEYALSSLPIFKLADCARQRRFRHISKTLDRSITWDGKKFARLGLVNELRHNWPGLIDLRLVGWVKQVQLALPTTYEQWQQIVKSWNPYGIRRIDERTFVLTFLQVQKSKSYVWVVITSLRERPVIDQVVSYRVVKKDDSKILALPSPVFQSEMHYENGLITSTITTSGGVVWRWDDVYQEDFRTNDDLFSDQWLSERGGEPLPRPG